MSEKIEKRIEEIINEQMEILNRKDLYRKPLVAFSSAKDARYEDLKNIIGAWHQTPTEILPDAKSVITYFIPFTEEVAMAPKKTKAPSSIWGESYQLINAHFRVINQAIADYLMEEGYSVEKIKMAQKYDKENFRTSWSHKSAAVIAGIGAFSVNQLVITEKGSGGRFSTLITSADLTNHQKPVENKCLYLKNKTCGLCLEICPPKALSAEGFDKSLCDEELIKNGKMLQESFGLDYASVCGKCISICPFAYIE